MFKELMCLGVVHRPGRGQPRVRPTRVCGDKGYSSREMRACLRRSNLLPCSKVSAHSNRDVVAGFGLRLWLFSLTGSSAMNSAHKNSEHCPSSGPPDWSLPLD